MGAHARARGALAQGLIGGRQAFETYLVDIAG